MTAGHEPGVSGRSERLRGQVRTKKNHAHAFGEGVLAGAWQDEARLAAVLRRRVGGSSTASEGSGGRHEALSQRDTRKVLLYEEDAQLPSGVAVHLRHRPRLRQRDRFPNAAGYLVA